MVLTPFPKPTIETVNKCFPWTEVSMCRSKKVVLSILLLCISTLCQARLIQIIHTNDLHSYFTGYYNGDGGYARLLTKIKQLKEEAAANEIEVLQLDAGDWGEGSSFFLSDNGSDSIKALELLGVEIATIGNHDYQLGGNVLGKQIRAANVSTKFVLANLEQTPDMELGNTLSPYVDVDRGEIAIRVIGLTTSEDFFQYSVSPGKILSSKTVGEAEAKKGKEEGRELVIALTHLGVYEDESLVRNSSSIDVVIGGHSHSKLSKVNWEKNKEDKLIPIVQAWAHGLAVGSLLLDVSDSGEVKVVEYKLHEIVGPLDADQEMSDFIQTSVQKRNEKFEYKWDEIIGETETPITGYVDGYPVNKSSCWGRHMARAARKAVNASVGIHIAGFEGVYKPAGPVTFGDIVDHFPHFRKFGDQGWEIVTVYMSGFILKPVLYWVDRQGYGLSFSGLGYKEIDDLEDKATYTIAFPAEVALAIKTSFPEYRKYLKGLKYTGQFYWPVMINYVKENSPIKCR
jgi:2',3'-cyclic-nucleotide 2'-phosphodiesterase (5'-nucleotidase family)